MQCLQGLEASLNARQKHVDVLSANVGRVWTSDKQRPLATEMVIVDGPIKVLGSVSAPKAVIVAGAQRVPGATPDDVSRQIGEIGASVAGMENELKNVVFKSLPQTIQGNGMRLNKLGNCGSAQFSLVFCMLLLVRHTSQTEAEETRTLNRTCSCTCAQQRLCCFSLRTKLSCYNRYARFPFELEKLLAMCNNLARHGC